MSCPTCSCTLQNLGLDAGPELNVRVFWCPRCGTIRREVGDWSADDVPRLVGRCRQFAAAMVSGVCHATDWIRLGISEAINKPGERA